MSQIRITLTIDIPDDARVSTPDVDYANVPQEPPYLMPEPAYDPEQIIRPAAVAHPGCPQHGAMERFPAGVSKRSGKPYGASWRCPVEGCTTKPIWDKVA